MFIRVVIIVMSLLALLTLCSNIGCEAGGRNAAVDDRNQKIIEKTRNVDIPIVFYGKIIDDSGMPVNGAKAYINIKSHHWNPVVLYKFTEITVKSNSSGLFVAKFNKGHSLNVINIEKPGYEIVDTKYRLAGKYYEYAKRSGILGDLFVPDSDKPVVLKLRKKGETTFVCSNSYNGWDHMFNFEERETGTRKGCDFPRGVRILEADLTNPKPRDGEVVLDLIGKATWEPKTRLWTYVLSAVGKGGVQVSDKLLYEAPESGYQPSVTFTASEREHPLNQYLYLKVRTPPIYARVRLKEIRVNKNSDGSTWFKLHYDDVVMNPYGERNFELDTELPFDVTHELEREIREAFRLGEMPAKPDLKRRVEQWEKRQPMLDRVKRWFKQ